MPVDLNMITTYPHCAVRLYELSAYTIVKSVSVYVVNLIPEDKNFSADNRVTQNENIMLPCFEGVFIQWLK